MLLHLDSEDPDPDPLSWFSEEGYDTTWQEPLRAYEVPGSQTLVITVQRASHLVLYDPRERRVVGGIELDRSRSGNSSIYFRRHADEMWVDNYDTLLRLRPGSWEVLDSLRLQEEQDGMGKYIGSFWFPSQENVCVVARPFSGDVVLVDPGLFRVLETVPLGGKPLDAVLLRDGTVIARDWENNQLLRASVMGSS